MQVTSAPSAIYSYPSLHTFYMSDIQDHSLQLGISENESLTLQLLVVVAGFIALLFQTSSVIYKDLWVSTVIVYAATAYGFWYLIKAVRGAPNALKPNEEPITLEDFAFYLIVGIPVSLVVVILYRKLLYRIDIRLLDVY